MCVCRTWQWLQMDELQPSVEGREERGFKKEVLLRLPGERVAVARAERRGK